MITRRVICVKFTFEVYGKQDYLYTPNLKSECDTAEAVINAMSTYSRIVSIEVTAVDPEEYEAHSKLEKLKEYLQNCDELENEDHE